MATQPQIPGGNDRTRKETTLAKRHQKGKTIKFLIIYLYMILVLFTLLTVASYTWFSLSKTPRVSDMHMYINAPTGMQIALTHDAEEWGNQLDFKDMVGEVAPLRPVTWSDADQRFYAAIYGYDGRRTGQWEPLTDIRHANKNTLDGYYIKSTFFARSDVTVDVGLSPAVETDEGKQGSGTFLIGYPLWNSEEIAHYNGGKGAECAMRIGIRITPVDKTGESIGDTSDFYIYEPNSDLHLDGSFGYIPTPAINGNPSLVQTDKLILQSASVWTEADPVQRDVVMHNLGEFTTDTALFRLMVDSMVKIELYVWLEGQDVDCTNQINRAQILANIQFIAKEEDQSGLTPIDP